MEYIITVLKHVVNDLKNNYISDNNVYSEFEKKYNEALSYRNKRQEISDKYFSIEKFEYELLNKKSKFSKNVKLRECEFSNLKNKVNLKLEELYLNKSHLNQKVNELKNDSSNISENKKMIENSIDVLKLQKPGFFQFSRKKTYNEQMRKYSDDLIKILEQERSTKLKIDAFIKDLKHIEDQILYENKLIEDKNSEIVRAIQNEDKEIKNFKKK